MREQAHIPTPRVSHPDPRFPSVTYVEAGITYEDGARITVEWSDPPPLSLSMPKQKGARRRLPDSRGTRQND